MNIPFVDLKAQYHAIKEEVDAAINEVVESTEFIGGKYVKEFETAFAAFVGARYCVGVSNGTSAIEAALRAAGIGKGDEVITVPHTFIASAESITAAGARPVFVDVDPETGLLDPARLTVTSRTKAILPVHLYGQSCDMQPIMDFARAHNLIVIEDCAQAHGATYRGKTLPYSGFGTFSFYPGKNLGAYGDGGAVVCNDDRIHERLLMIRDHGRKRGEKYTHSIEAFNFRLDALQAAVLSVKLKHLKGWNDCRVKNAAAYQQRLSGSIRVPADNGAVFHLFVIKHPRRDRLQSYLKERGIATGVHYPIPLHLQPAYDYMGFQTGDFPVAEELAKTVLSLPMYPELTEEQILFVCDAIKAFNESEGLVVEQGKLDKLAGREAVAAQG